MKQTKSTSKFALILIAILVVVFASAFSTTLFADSINYVDSDLNVADAGNNTSGGTEYQISAKGTTDILSGINNAAYWWDYQTGTYGGTSKSNAAESKYGWYYNASFKGSRSSTQASMIYLRLPYFMTTTKATVSITVKGYSRSHDGNVTTNTNIDCAMEATKRTTSFGGSGLYISEKGCSCTSWYSNAEDSVTQTYTKDYTNLGIGGCISVGVWCNFDMKNSGGSRTRTVYCIITGFSITLEGNYNTGTINYNSNGGTGSDSQTITYKTDFKTADSSKISKTGYHNTKWNSKSDLSGTNYDFTTVRNVSSFETINLATTNGSSTTLYAVWAKNTYSISYDLDSGTAGSPAPTSATYDSSFSVGAPTRSGYSFVGWSVSGDLNTSTAKWGTTSSPGTAITSTSTYCVNGSSYPVHFINLASKNGGTVKLTAHWSPNYKISFTLNGGSGTYDTTTSYNPYQTITITAPTRIGYTFTGWTVTSGLNSSTAKWGTSSSPTTQIASSSTVCVNGATGNVYFLALTTGTSVTLTANWTGISYNLNYAGMDGASHGTNHPATATFGTPFALSTPSVSKSGYAFTGWIVTSNLNTTYGKWGTTSSPSEALTSTQLCYNGTSDVYFVSLNPTAGTTVTITANWAKVSYTITFAANGGTGSMSNQTGTYNDANITIKTNTFKKDDAFFTGWKDSKNNSYSNGGSITAAILQSYQNGNPTTTSVTIPLTAQWWSGDLEFGADGSGSGKWGSSTNPYIIRNATHLSNLKTIVNGGTLTSISVVKGSIQGSTNAGYTNPQATAGGQYSGCFFKLAASITTDANSVNIGTSSYPFKGTFDGNNKTISGVSISTTAIGNGLGLFGYINGATIKNLNVSATINIYGQSYVGAIVGYATSSTITNCTSAGSVTSSSSINTTAAGYSNKSSDLPLNLIQWDYSKDSDGEAIDKIFDNNTGTKVCSSTKTMSFIVDLGSLYKLTGFSFSCANDTSTYKTRNISHVRIWGFTSNPNYTDCWTGGEGGKPTDSDPVNKGVTGAVSIFENSISMTTSAYLRQDFNFSSVGKYRYVWVYIKGGDRGVQFSEFDVIGEKSEYLGGTIGYAHSGSTISNCTNNATVSGVYCIGGVAGGINFANSGTQCTLSGTLNNTGSVTGDNGFIGGVVGMCFTCTASNVTCTNSGTVNGGSSDSVGGIFGFLNGGVGSNGTFTNAGAVTGGTSVGGIVGRSQSSLKKCTNQGNITANSAFYNGECSSNTGAFAGGITGYTTGSVTISNSYNQGTITASHGSGNFVGGITGYAQGDVTYCFNKGNISGAEYLAGITGHSVSAVDYCYDYNGSGGSTITASAGTPHIGGISGGSVSSGTSWIIGDYSYSSSNLSSFGKRIYGYSSFNNIVPVVYSSGSASDKTWAGITTNNINGVKITETTSSGYYLKLTSDSHNGSTYFEPSEISSTGSSGAYTVIAKYNFTDSAKKNNIYIYQAQISVSNNIKEYDAKPLAITNSAQIAGYGNEFTYENGKTTILNVEDSTKASLKVYVTKNSTKVYVGEYANIAATITAIKIQVTYESATFTYDAQKHHITLKNVVKYSDASTCTLSFNATTQVITIALKDSSTEKVQVSTTEEKDAGTYNGVASYSIIAGNGNKIGNYEFVNNGTFVLTINKRELTVSSPTWTDGNSAGAQNRTTDALAFTYNGHEQGLNAFTVSNTLAASNVNYGGNLTRVNSNVAAGSDIYTYTISLADTKNFTLSYMLGSAKTSNQTTVTYTYKILQRSIQDTIVAFTDNSNIFNSDLYAVSSTTSYYTLNTSYSSYTTKPAIIYSSATNDTSYKQYIKLFYNTDELISGTDYVAITDSSVPKLTDIYTLKKGTESDPSITITSIAKGNYNGTCKVWFTLMGSDYGKLSSGTGVWGTSTNPYVISSAEHLLRLSHIVNSEKANAWNSIVGVNSVPSTGTNAAKATDNTYSGCYFEVTANVSVSKAGGFNPIGTSDKRFKATQFNGDNSIITINYADTTKNYVGIFGYVDGTKFIDVKTAGAVSGKTYVGALAGYVHGKLNGTFDNTANVTGTGHQVGGIIGGWKSCDQTEVSIIRGSNTGTISGVNYVGGAIGYIDGPDNYTSDGFSCKDNIFDKFANSGAITASGTHGAGIVGYAYDATYGKAGLRVYFIGCTNTASVSANQYAGGIVGYSRDAKIYGCVNGTNGTTATIKASDVSAGGIAGNVGGYSTLSSSSLPSGHTYSGNRENVNYMAVSAKYNAGGVFGQASWASVGYIKNYGAVTATNDNSYAGGIVGYMVVNVDSVNGVYTLSESYNYGAVTAKKYTAGIVGAFVISGSVKGSARLQNVYNSGAITGTSYVGGIVGKMQFGNFAGTVRNTAIIKGSSDGSYVGGIAGHITLSKDISSTNLESYGTYGAKDYVGGICGYINTNGKAISAKIISGITYNSVRYDALNVDKTDGTRSGETVDLVGKFGGNFFGYLEGNSTITFSSGTSSTGQIDAYESKLITRSCGVCIGGICGANINVVLDFRNLTTNFLSGFSIIGRSNQTVEVNGLTLTNAELAGGVCGYNAGTIYLNASTELSFGSIFVANNGKGKYIGGIAGYNAGTIENVKIKVAVGSSSSNNYRSSYAGGICGYNTGTITNVISVSGAVNGVDYLGGLVGYNTSSISTTGTMTHSSVVNGNGTTGFVGGVVGYSSGAVEIKNFTQSGAVTSSGSYVGGLIGYSENAKITSSKYTVTEISGVSYVGGIAGYWGVQSANAINDNVTSSASVLGTGSFVGGIAGYLTVSAANLFTSYTPTIKNGTSLVVQGKSYVGGLFGYFKGGEYKLSTSGSQAKDTVIHIDNTKVNVKVTSTGTTATSKGDAIGGLFGYVASCGVVFDTNWSTSYAFTASSTGATFTSNANYVGGIAGIIGKNATLEYNTSSTTGTNTVISNNMKLSITGDFVGGIAGYVSPYAGAYNQNLVFKFGDLIKFQNVTNDISGTNYVGGLFGYIGDSIEEITYTVNEVPITKTVYLNHSTSDLADAVKADTAPSGYNADNYCYLYDKANDTYAKYFYKSITYLTAATYNESTYVGPTEMDQMIYESIGSGIYKPISYSFEVDTGQKETVIVVNHSNKTEFSALLTYKNATSIVNASYETQIATNENSGARLSTDMNYLVFEPKYAVNENKVTATSSYAGGLIGYVSTHTKLNLYNAVVTGDLSDSNIVAALSVRNGNANKDANVTAASYCGGIAGYVSNEGHQFENIVNIGAIGSATSTYVGGLVGKADGGAYVDCISTSKGHITAAMASTTNNYLGTEYVGGLFGSLTAGSVTNSYSMGFLFGTSTSGTFTANTSSLKGGVVGYAGSSAVISNTWTYYIAQNIAYNTNSQNTYGKYVLIEANSSVAILPRFGELAFIAGLYTGVPQTLAASKTGTVVIEKGKVSIAMNLYDTLPSGSQLAFYDADGFDRIYSEIDNSKLNSTGSIASRTNNVVTLTKSQILYLKLATTCASLIIDIVPITFSNIPVYSKNISSDTTINDDTNDDNETNLRGAYVRPSTYAGYDINVFTATYGTNKYIKNINATIAITIGANRFEIGYINKNITTGDEASPWLISNATEWNEFATKVKGGTSYSGQTVRLTNNITLSSTISNLAGSSTASFAGTFDGDGYTINIGSVTANANGTSLFMNASGATFKNLTIEGSIAGAGNSNIGGFVGAPGGNVTFNNCTSKVEITNVNENAGGFVGYSNNISKISFLTCVNDAYIESKANTQPYYKNLAWRNTYAQVSYGTGGIIGQVSESTTISIDSCRNTANGTIVGGHNVGGIIGVAHSTTNIYNCANSGKVWAVTGLALNSSRDAIEGDHTKDAENVNSYRGCSNAGGIIGKLSGTGILRLYSSYNDGQITGISNIVGGLVGCIGNISVGASGSADSSTSAGMSYICYCYNTGLVQAGGTMGKYTPSWNVVETIMNGTIVGGIVGFCGPAYIAYTYNTGRVISWSGASYGGWEYQARMGGIIGQSAPTDNNTKKTVVMHSYNVGTIELQVSGTYSVLGYRTNQVDFHYGAGIIGYLDAPFNSGNAKDYTSYNNIFSLKGCVYRPSVARTSGNSEWLDAGEAPSTLGVDSTGNRVSGTLVELNELTATYYEKGNSEGYSDVICIPSALARIDDIEKKKSGSAISMIDWSGNDIDYSTDAKFKNGEYYAWVFAYGCLPQLAMFSLDTKEGLAMTSTSFGQDEYGNWKGDRAGTKESPYIIKDGIDLLLLSALNSAQYHNFFYTFKGKYIEFANGTNNIAKVASKTITLANDDTTRTNNYKASDGTNTITGKSYHIYSKGAICNDRPTISSGTAYGAWKNRNRYYNGSAWASGCGITSINFYPIGMKGPFSCFEGNISGEQGTGGNTVINNVKVSIVGDSSVYAGLFGYVQNANISYITVNGTINARTTSTTVYSANKGGEVMAGAIAGFAGGNTTIEHCFAGSSDGACTVLSYANSENPSTYVGGIVGKASTLIFDNSLDNSDGNTKNDGYNYSNRNSFTAGTEINIIACESNAAVTTPKNNAGGIVGYAQANGYNSATTSGIITGAATKIKIVDCNVKSGTITAADRKTNTMDYGTNIGGMIGASDSYVEMTVSGGQVGNSDYKSVTGKTNVNIIGENKVGGIIGSASVNDVIGVTGANAINIYGDTKIARGDKWGNVNNNMYNSEDYGVSIGGLVGFAVPLTTTENSVTVVFAGEINSYAYVLVDIESTIGTVNAVGGAIGYMGAGAFFKNGCAISIDGVVEVGEKISTPYGIGGVAGIANNVAFDGTFKMYATISATKANRVGGFIGYSLGQTEILAGQTAKTIGSQIVISSIIQGVSEVGGFIGEIDNEGSLNIGSASYRGTDYLGTLTIDIQAGSYIIASGNSSNESNVGGIVGFNDGDISIVKGTLENAGDVIGGADIELPSGYTGLKYIQTTGSQYIDTGIIPTNTTGLSIVLSSQDVTSDFVYLGQRPADQARSWIGTVESKVYYGWNTLRNYNGTGTQRYMSNNSLYSLQMNFLNSRENVFQGEKITTELETLISTTQPIYIGTGNDKGTPYTCEGKYSSIKIYSVKISEGTSVAHNYIPCRQTSDGAVGLYDVIGKAFYKSKTSTAFVAGTTYEYIARDNVGGIIGLNEGTVSFETPSITNSGYVVGNNNIGGTVGFLSTGSIAGTFTNSGNVEGKQFVGGSFGNTTQEATFTIPTKKDKDGNLIPIGNSLFINKGNVTGEQYIGGSIGIVLGEIEGYSSYLVKFTNEGLVTTGTSTTAQYIGGSVGSLTGTVSYASFANKGNITTKGYKAIGGSIGIVGVPSALAGILHKDATFNNVHFEFNSTSSLSVGPDKYDTTTGATTAGGVGGIIGVIYEAKEFSASNSFYVLSSVSAPNLSNVGGSIGLIQGGTSIIVEGLLAYNTVVTGYQNVGGVVGAVKNNKTATVSIQNSFNVSVADASDVVAKISKGKVYGGIVGYVEDTKKTDSSTSYWVKGFPNIELASLNIYNVKNVGHSTVSTISETFADVYSLASTVYATYDDKVTYYSRSGSGTSGDPYKYNKATGVTAANYGSLYVNEYKYSIAFCNSHPITTFLDFTKQETLKDTIYSWDSYVANKFNSEVSAKTVYQDGNGNFVRMTPDGNSYTTGEAYSGYYFLFAKDTGTITVQHSASTSSTTLKDLDFWKRIVNSYTADEIAAGTNTVELRSSIAPRFQNDSVSGTAVTSVTKGGIVKEKTLYAKASSNYGSGYFLYVKSSNSSSTAGLQTYHEKSDDINSKDFYIVADLNQNPYNVVVYYRSVGMGSALTYNGNTRFAPLTLKSSEVNYLSAVPEGQNTARVNTYAYYSPADGGTARNVGTYMANVTLYYYDATGYPYEVGGVTNGEWRIVARQLQAEVASSGKREYDGTSTEGYVDIDISNFEVNDATNATVKIIFSPSGNNHSVETGTYTYIYTMGSVSAPVGEGGSSSKYITPYGNVELTTDKPIAGDELFNTLTSPMLNTYTATIRFKITNALSYNVLVDTFEGKSADITNDYTMNSKTGVITVQARELEITFKDGGSHQYDGSEFTNDIIISNWATSDSSASARQDWFASFFPYYKDNNNVVTYYKNYADATNNSDPTVALVTTGGVSKVSVKGTNKGAYYFGFNSSKTTSTSSIGTSTGEIYSSDGNYKIKLTPTNPKAVLQIAENSLTLKFASTNKTYDTATTTITATFTARYALADTTKWAVVLDDYLYSIASKTDSKQNIPTVAVDIEYTSKTVATITFTTHKNADTYVAQILGPKVTNENCPVDLTSSPTTGTQVTGRDCWKGEVTINKKALTVNTTATAKSSGGYIYNTSYQGISTITLSGFAGSENINHTGAYGSGNGTAVSMSSSTLSASAATNGYTITGEGDAGTYTIYIYLTSPTTSNYSVARSDKTWTISKYTISLGTGSSTSSTYNGQIQTIPAVWATDANLSGTGATRTYYKDTLTIAFVYTAGGSSANNICNVGTYTMKIASVNSVTAKRGNKDKSSNYVLDEASTNYTATHEVLPATITVGFNGNTAYVYTGNQQGPMISTAAASGTTLTQTSLTNISSSFTESKFTGLATGETLTITLTGSGNVSASSSAYNAATGTLTVEGNNGANEASVSGNYILTANSKSYSINKSKIKVEMSASSLTKVYDGTVNAVIGLSSLTITSTNGGALLPSSAIQDNNTSVTERVAGNLYGTYDTKDVGTGKTVTFSISNTSNTNFVLVDNSGNETDTIPSLQIKTGVITQRPVTITLNLTRNKATKTYDGTTAYATYTNASASNGKTATYRSGQGFVVSNVVASDDFVVTASFKESDRSREYFDAFINNITREGTSPDYTYKTTTNTFKMLEFVVSSASGNDYANYSVEVVGFTNAKAISTSDGGNVIKVYDSHETESSKKNAISATEITISITAKTITATYNNQTQSYANDDNSFNLNWKAVTANPTSSLSGDGVSFAMVNGWMYKTGIDPNANSTGVDISDTTLAQEYKKYTTIRGSANSKTLSAKLISSNGKHLNYILRQQPTLTIGYFVNQNGYEINSYAGLMMATYYYSTTFMATTYDDESIATATLITTWNSTFTYAGTSYTCSYSDYEGNNLPASIKALNTLDGKKKIETWDEFFELFRAVYNEGKDAKFQIASDGIVYEGEGTNGTWGYWVDVAESRTTYLEFRQTKNIDARLTANDIAIIEGQFGATWGFGTKYLSNFIKCSAGEVCVAINAVFPVIKVSGGSTYGFVGTYNGNGYTIENMTIVANYIPGFSYGVDSIYEQLNHGTYHNASAGGVGMFALVNSATLPSFTNKTAVQHGAVNGVNIRNATISVNDSIATTKASTLSVGGIIGVSQMTTAMLSSSFHGSIVVNTNGTRNHIGGLIGLYIQPTAEISTTIDDVTVNDIIVQGAIVAGTITEHQATGSNASDEFQPGCGDIGGIIGRAVGITSAKNIKVKDVVSVTQILAYIAHGKDSAQNIGGIIGTAIDTASSFTTGTVGYLTDSALRILAPVSGSETVTVKNSTVGYQNSGSTAAANKSYDTLRSGSKTAYASTLYSPSTLTKGTYDVIKETAASTTDTRISSRLVDIIDIYMLMYSRGTAEVGEVGNKVTVTTKLATSTLVGTKTGTTTDRINIVNQQHIALLRELPFANFNLVDDVEMYKTHSANMFEGFFFGTIQNTNNKKIYLAENSLANMFKWTLSGHEVPTSTGVKASA